MLDNIVLTNEQGILGAGLRDQGLTLGGQYVKQLGAGGSGAAVRLAIETLHPMYARDCACINTRAQALALCERLGPEVGITADVYHTLMGPRRYSSITACFPDATSAGVSSQRLVGADPPCY